MTSTIIIEQADGERRIEPRDLPVVVGGPEADIMVSGSGGSAPVAYLGVNEGEPFLQPAPGATGVICNGDPLSTSQWLRSGDVIRIGTTSISIERQPGTVRLRVDRRVTEVDTEPPTIKPTDAPSTPIETGEGGTTVRPVDFEPKPILRSRSGRRAPHPLLVVTWIVLGLLAVAAWFLFSSRAVEVRVLPEPDQISIVGTWMRLELGGRYLLRPGSYGVVAEKAGYRPLEAVFEVTRSPNQLHEFELEKLPGLLTLQTIPSAGISVTVDGESKGVTPLVPFELAPGEHTVVVSSNRFEGVSHTVEIEGGGENTLLRVELTPLWAPVSIDSRPPGATVHIDGDQVGVTPLTADILEGGHDFEIHLAGFKRYRSRLNVLANQPYHNPLVILQPSDGSLVLTSEPPGATVSVGGEFRGQTPIEMELQPGVNHTISVSKSGYDTASDTIRLESGRARELHVSLDARHGEIEIRTDPADAELLVDGDVVGSANQTLRLTAVPHLIEVRREGYQQYRQTLTPRTGFPQLVQISLITEEQARLAARKSSITTSQGQDLRLIEPGKFRMGASRREPGRRANETLRDVELTRPFYLATEEVSNKEYREFREGHRSGQAGGRSLDLDGHPVVSVSWEEAARYCNWLSEKDGLPPAYVIRNGRLVGASPATTGYRLPTEAEWAWVARFAGTSTGRKYPWGDSLPVAAESGNYADAAAAGIVDATIGGYRDGYSTTSPVDSFEPNSVGILNLGGNVAEWMQDYYSIYSSGSGGVQLDPKGPEEGEYHVIRGSSWMDSNVTELRLSFRDYGNKPRPDVGFRIARFAE